MIFLFFCFSPKFLVFFTFYQVIQDLTRFDQTKSSGVIWVEIKEKEKNNPTILFNRTPLNLTYASSPNSILVHA